MENNTPTSTEIKSSILESVVVRMVPILIDDRLTDKEKVSRTKDIVNSALDLLILNVNSSK